MAKERVYRTICDRCASVYEEVDTPAAGSQEPTQARNVKAPLVYIERGGVESIKYEDLCEKCVDRVSNLIKDIMPLAKGKSDKKDDKPKKEKKDSKEKKDKPSDKEDSKKERSAPAGDKPAG